MVSPNVRRVNKCLVLKFAIRIIIFKVIYKICDFFRFHLVFKIRTAFLFLPRVIGTTVFINTMSHKAEALLESNAIWAAKVSNDNPNFFPDSTKGQTPHVRPLLIFKLWYSNLVLDSLDRVCRFQSARIGHHCFQTWRHLCPPKYRQVRFHRHLFSSIL